MRVGPFYSGLRGQVCPESELSSPEAALAPADDDFVALSPVSSTGPSGWSSLPAHLLEVVFANLRDSSTGRWPSRKVRRADYTKESILATGCLGRVPALDFLNLVTAARFLPRWAGS